MALALQFKIKLSTDGKTLTIIDRTGAYSGLNVGGFSSPNPAISDATSATIKYAKRNADGSFGTETTVNVYNTLPSISADEFNIVSATAFPDGIYRIIYTVAGSSGGTPFSTSVTRYDVLRNSIAVCYQKKSVVVVDCSCSCDDIKKSFKCFSLYMRLLRSAECCSDLNNIDKYLIKLTDLCKDCNCC